MPDRTTPAAFRRRAERVFRAGNPDAVGLVITWTRCNRCQWADGSQGFSGTMQVTAPGYRTRAMIATLCHGDMAVR